MSIFNTDIDEFTMCIHGFFSDTDHTHPGGKHLWEYIKNNRKVYVRVNKMYAWAKIFYIDEYYATDEIRRGYKLQIIRPVLGQGEIKYDSFFSLWFDLAYYPDQTYNMHKYDLDHCELCNAPIFSLYDLEGESMIFRITDDEYDLILDTFKYYYKQHLNTLKSHEIS